MPIKEAKNKNMLVVDMMDVLKERIKEEEHVEGMKEDHDENEDESEYDEHVWLSLINAHEVVRYLSNEVQKLDDVHKKTYEENTIRYLNDIDDLNHQYEQVVEINLSEVRPTVAFPHLPGNGHTIDEIEEMDKAIVSVKYALDYSKTILVIPMDLDSKYKGNNKLIKEGADVLASIDDLVDN